ncbi:MULTISPECIES: copper resistance CopC family protein [Halomonadaceae]|uniref:copper resistance CopC family protein n=1 Tax=Halomonadaceae TaxID=28256 RepID=UPI001F488012|nr:copper resistance protein CopC [Halomonas desiderata]MCE8012690.1 copper resistance protein CopC [Halomonas desiderata]
MQHTKLFSTLALAIWLLAVSTAQAHAPFQGSVPKDGATLSAEAVPEQLELKFGHTLRLTSVMLRPHEGEAVSLDTSNRLGSEHSLALPELAPGHYVVQWRGMAVDGHVMSGNVEFTVAAAR